MSQNQYKAKIYQGNQWNATTKKKKTGLCLSGGGSRALSAGLGQLIGLKSINHSNGGTLLDSIDYISSVSGGTWLTSIYTFSTNQNLDELLGTYMPPNTLEESNIGDLSPQSIGQIPNRLSYEGMIELVHDKIGFFNIIDYPEVRKWVWSVIVGELVLRPYGLYDGVITGTKQNITPMPRRFFSLDLAYMESNIKNIGGVGTANGQLNGDDFYFHQSDRPFPIMNTNIKIDYQAEDSPLLPVQGTPIAIGATEDSSQKYFKLKTNGAVEAFAFTSTWRSQNEDYSLVDIDRRYSLVDLVSCSSAFFAETVGSKIKETSAILDTLGYLSKSEEEID